MQHHRVDREPSAAVGPRGAGGTGTRARQRAATRAAIVDAAAAKDRQTGSGEGVQMPSFFGYLGWAMVILLPVLVLNWLIWVR